MTDTIGTEADLWHVEVPSGEVLVVTLEQLDEAFNQGQVNEQTRVWQAGMDCAVPLSELLGLDEEEEEEQAPPPAPRYHAAIPPAPVLTPHALSQAMYPQAPAQSAYPQGQSAYPQARASVAPPSSAWPPVIAGPSSVPPPASSPTAWQANVPSVRPMAYDLSDDFVPFAQPKRRGAVVFALLGLIAVGAGAFVFVNGNGSASAAAAQAPAPVVVEAPRSHAYDPGNEPIHLKDVAPLEITKPDAPPAEAKPTTAEAATLREAALKAANSKAPKAHAHSKAAPARKSQSTSTSFKGTKSGSKYDPLNGAL